MMKHTPTIEIEINENDSISEAAEKFFKRYTKARNAKKEIAKRMEIVEAELKKLNAKKEKLEMAIAEEDEDFISQISVRKKKSKSSKKEINILKILQAQGSFTSSDGFEILVGRRSKDNDYLTFRVQNP